MKALIKYGLCLSLGLSPALAFGQGLQWRPAGNPAPTASASAAPSLGLSRPVPLDGSGVPALQPIVRAQNTEDPKPLPPGPLLNPPPGVAKGTPAIGDQAGKPAPKTSEFIAPLPTKQSAPVYSSSDACDNSCGTNCCGLFGRCGLFGHGGPGLFDRCCGLLKHDWLGHGPCPNDACNPCCRPMYWAYAEYLGWTPQNQSYPPLVTVSPVGTPAGIIGPATTMIAFNGFDSQMSSGVRVGGGFWFHDNGRWGLDGTFWTLGTRSHSFSLGGAGDQNIARPFTEVGPINPGPNAELVAFPGLVNGTVAVQQRQELWGLDANLRRNLWCGPRGWVDLEFGYRYMYLSEDLNITESLVLVPPNGAPAGAGIIVSDRFHTSNTFNGVQLGLATQWNIGQRWYLAGNFKFAVGNVRETVDIQGNTIFTGGGLPTSIQNGGLLALPSNIGRLQADKFAVLPELGLKLGYNITPHLSIYAGYDFLYLSSVVRPAEQIDLNLNSTQRPNRFGPQPLVGVAAPAPRFTTQDFWVQGFNVGLKYQW